MNHATLSYAHIRDVLDRQELFENKTWKISPEPWPLSRKEVGQLEEIGTACFEFYRALDLLYARSVENRNLLRNKKLEAPWVAEYIDRGKPRRLIEHARLKAHRGSTPRIIRPDLLMTDDGFALTEIDSVPGGIGLTAFLNRLYRQDGRSLVGSDDRMIHAFYASLSGLVANRNLPLIAIVVADEARTYRPEMEWLAQQLRDLGKRVYCIHPSEIMPLGDALCASIDGNPEKIDVVYRFWELFDLENIPFAKFIMDIQENSDLVVTPPMRHFQEEKLSLALFHHHLLEDFWRENLPRRVFRLLRRIIPKSWIMDRVELPPNAVLDAPLVGGKPIWRWEQLSEATQRERNLIIKISGFHETAWGARSVLLGSDLSREEWQKGIEGAIQSSDRNLHILQEYRKPRRQQHPVFVRPDELRVQEGRVRLTPFYAVSGEKAELIGALSTFCPADKKIIHGMRDAVMLPSVIVD